MRCSAENPNIRGAYFVLIFTAIAAIIGFSADAPFANADPRKAEGLKPHQIVTGSAQTSRRAGWDRLFDTGEYVYGTEPAAFVVESVAQILHQATGHSKHSAGDRGVALDIAAGEGRHAVYLALKGYHVDAVDFSEVALRKAHLLAKRKGVKIKTIIEELKKFQFKESHYDLIVNINFLDREIIPSIPKSLKKGGFLIFENPTVEQLSLEHGPTAPREYLLAKGELRELFKKFPEMEILIYRETNDGRNALASLLAVKR